MVREFVQASTSAALIACATVQTADVTILNESEIKALIVGRGLVVLPQGADSPVREVFEPDGVYRRLGGRASLHGRYSVQGNQLCHDILSQPRVCRSFAWIEGKLVYRRHDGIGGWVPTEVL